MDWTDGARREPWCWITEREQRIAEKGKEREREKERSRRDDIERDRELGFNSHKRGLSKGRHSLIR